MLLKLPFRKMQSRKLNTVNMYSLSSYASYHLTELTIPKQNNSINTCTKISNAQAFFFKSP